MLRSRSFIDEEFLGKNKNLESHRPGCFLAAIFLTAQTQGSIPHPDQTLGHHLPQSPLPGNGFSETEEFLKMCGGEEPEALPFQKTLWRLYDCPGYAWNLLNLPTAAYSGEIDKQKQAADMMGAALEKRGQSLTHIIGPKTGHKIEEGSIKEIRFETYTLRYHKHFWFQIDRLKEHWKQRTILVTRISYMLFIGAIAFGALFENPHPLFLTILGVGTPVFAFVGIISGSLFLTLEDD